MKRLQFFVAFITALEISTFSFVLKQSNIKMCIQCHMYALKRTHTPPLLLSLFSINETCILLHISELCTKLRASALFHEQVKLIHTERKTRKIQFDGCLPKDGSCIGNKMGDWVFRQPPLLHRK